MTFSNAKGSVNESSYSFGIHTRLKLKQVNYISYVVGVELSTSTTFSGYVKLNRNRFSSSVERFEFYEKNLIVPLLARFDLLNVGPISLNAQTGLIGYLNLDGSFYQYVPNTNNTYESDYRTLLAGFVVSPGISIKGSDRISCLGSFNYQKIFPTSNLGTFFDHSRYNHVGFTAGLQIRMN